MDLYINKGALRTIIEKVRNTNFMYDQITELCDRLLCQINLMPTITKAELFNTAELVWNEIWDEGTPDYPRECVSAGWECSNCGEDIGDYLTRVSGEIHYFDNFEEKPKLDFCPCCGRKFR